MEVFFSQKNLDFIMIKVHHLLSFTYLQSKDQLSSYLLYL